MLYKYQRVQQMLPLCLSGKETLLKEMQKMWVQSVGQKDPLEEGVAIYSNILAWTITWTE